jgi:tetratricopeptide (TPR) repeat protein
MKTRGRLLRLLLAAGLVASLGCGPNATLRRAQEQMARGELRSARLALEREREREPRSADVRIALGEVYYRIARDHLDRERDETGYLLYLERSVNEFLAALEIEPANGRPHFYLAMMDAYRGDLPKALRGFNNTRRLEPGGIACTNIAEIYVYMGHRHKARYWNRLGLRRGAPRWAATFNEMLLTWKEGDLARARRHFETLQSSHPQALETINVAELPEPPGDFEDFAGYCCRSPACGPYMREACGRLDLAVYDRELTRETILQELRIEMEKRRRLDEIYRQRKDLRIELETAPPAGR